MRDNEIIWNLVCLFVCLFVCFFAPCQAQQRGGKKRVRENETIWILDFYGTSRLADRRKGRVGQNEIILET